MQMEHIATNTINSEPFNSDELICIRVEILCELNGMIILPN